MLESAMQTSTTARIPRCRSSQCRLLTGCLNWRVVALLSILALQIRTSNCERSGSAIHQVSSAASGTLCIKSTDCGIGYRCKVASGICVRINCTERYSDCDSSKSRPLCGEGTTYRNRCELKKAECLQEAEIRILDDNECITLPPPPNSICKANQERVERLFLNYTDYLKVCNRTEFQKRADEGILDLADLIYCHHPQCTRERKYEVLQCSLLLRHWCWCSTPEGVANESTFQQNLPKEQCAIIAATKKSCEYEGSIYENAEVFNIGCGFCECLDGKVTCYEDFVPDANTELNATQLKLLKEVMLQIYFFQYSQEEHVLIDIGHIQQHPSTVTKARKDLLIPWKFSYFDRNGDMTISSAEEYLFQDELYTFVRCKLFFDHISELMDTNGDASISFDEWTSFFQICENELTSGSTSASGSVDSS